MPEYQPTTLESADSTALLQERAIVLGCGMAGIAAAAALSHHYEDVIIVEKDDLPERPEPRRGVPQSTQLHNLLSCAQINLENLMPGFIEKLRETGAGEAKVASETHVYELGIRMPERDLGLTIMSAWRPVIEHVARQRLKDEGIVAFESLGRVVGLRKSTGRVVNGVLIESEGGIKTLGASIVVDATGSGSQAPRWLRGIGEQTPIEDTESVGQWYVSTQFKRPANHKDSQDFWLTFPNPPETRGGLVSPIEDDRWYVSLSGRKDDTPPKTINEVRDYAATLGDQVIADLINGAEPSSTPSLFRKTNAKIRRYDLLAKPLTGFLPIGDSLASLNPLFGQGMSVASRQAVELDDLLKIYRLGTLDLPALTSRYLDSAFLSAKGAYDLGKSLDNIISGGSDTDNTGLRHKALARLIEEDPKLHKLYVSIWHLIEPASALEDPAITNRINEVSSELISER